jgi:Domain of unknown function (DUF4397)
MVRFVRWTLACAPALLAAACSSRSGSGTPATDTADTGSDTVASTPGIDGGSDAPSEVAVQGPQAFLRIADTSPDAPPLDVCVAPHGTATFQGPLVGQLAGGGVESAAGDAGTDTDAATPGVTYPQVSAYVALTPGGYDVRIVAAGAPSCDAPLVSDWTSLPPMADDTSTTLLVAGDFLQARGDAPLTVTMLTDDQVLAGGAVSLRAINAMPSQAALDFGLGTGSAWEPLLTDVTFAAASSQTASGEGTVDANGYTPIAPLLAQAVSARASSSPDGGTDVAAAMDVEIDLGSIATIIAIGGKTGDSANPPALLLCIDNTPSGGLLSDCSVAP